MSDNPTQATPIADAEKQAAGLAMTGMSTVLNAAPGTEPSWAKPAISVLTLVVFIALIVVAYVTGDKTSLAILSGVGASMAQQVAGYYLGSSSGSAHKTALLAAAPAIPGLPAA